VSNREGWQVARYAITGSSGLIGEALIASLRADGHTVQRVVRDSGRARPDDVVWDLSSRTIQGEKLEGVDVVVHLAGEPLGSARWTEETKRRIHRSREVGTRLIAETLAGLDERPRAFVSASGAHYYGDSGDEVLTEESSAGEGFLPQVCVAWEAAAQPARDAGIRTVHARTGVVIAEDGPLIEKIDLPFRLGVGGRVGHGRQYVPWISLEDEVRALRFLADRDELAGPVNLVAPEPVTNRELTKALGQVLHRPTALIIPPFALRLLYGEMGITLAMDSLRVVPQRLLDAGFTYTHTSLVSALEAALLDERAA
jgi:uncharacterized protein